jgi:hypothetical protein
LSSEEIEAQSRICSFDGLTRINEIYAKNKETAQIVEKR